MAANFLHPGSIVALHHKAVDRLLTAGDGDAALLYLALAAGKNGAALPWHPDRLEKAQNLLLSLKLIDSQTPVLPAPPVKLEPETPPDYTTADVATALQNGAGFAGLVPEVERLLGKTLSPADLKTLLLIQDFFGLPPEVILTLVGWCVDRSAQRYGPGRKPTLTQIRREGARWQKAGVDTLEAADAHIRRLTEMNTRTTRILEILGIRGRKPVAREQTYLDSWAQMPFDDSAIQLAYEKTVFQLQKFNWSYMNSILLSWHKKGLHTAAAVNGEENQGTPRYRPARPGQSQQPTVASSDIDRLFQEAGQNPHKEE